MAQFQLLRILISVITALIFAIIAVFVMVTIGFAVGFVMFWILLAFFFLQGQRTIPADPPIRGIPTFWGNYIDADNGGFSLHSGRWFLPWSGLLFDLVRYDASQINLTMSVQERTPDRGGLILDPYFTYVVNPDHPVWFIQAGDKEIVELKFNERVDSRLREWISSQNEGPLTWSEALQSNGLAMDIIIQKLFPGTLPDIPPAIIAAIPGGVEIPISTFIKYFTGRPPLPEKAPEKNEGEIRSQEYRAKQTLDSFKQTNRPTWNSLEAAVRARTAVAEAVKGGIFPARFPNGFPINNLGILVTLAGLGNIRPEGATAAAADKVAEARQIALVNTIESDNFQEQVEKFAKAHGNDMPAATEAIQLLRKLKTKSTVEQQFALRTDNVEALTTILGPLGKAFAEWVISRGKPPVS